MSEAGRAIAIIIELIILAVLFYCMLYGGKLIAFDMGAPKKYAGIINVALAAVGSILLLFLISHLITFYP